jgi:thiol-disulfide isomerase/thioredoxin
VGVLASSQPQGGYRECPSWILSSRSWLSRSSQSSSKCRLTEAEPSSEKIDLARGRRLKPFDTNRTSKVAGTTRGTNSERRGGRRRRRGDVVTWSVCFRLARTGTQATVGNSAPEFELRTLDGDTLSSSDLKGHPVVVNFWASWCVPCREEAPLLGRTWRKYKDDGVIFLGVNIKDAESDAKRFIADFGITYPMERDVDQQLMRSFVLRGIPETFFIDESWRFASTESGARRGEQGEPSSWRDNGRAARIQPRAAGAQREISMMRVARIRRAHRIDGSRTSGRMTLRRSGGDVTRRSWQCFAGRRFASLATEARPRRLSSTTPTTLRSSTNPMEVDS